MECLKVIKADKIKFEIQFLLMLRFNHRHQCIYHGGELSYGKEKQREKSADSNTHCLSNTFGTRFVYVLYFLSRYYWQVKQPPP